MIVKVKRLTKTAKLPKLGSEYAAAVDLHADIEREIDSFDTNRENVLLGVNNLESINPFVSHISIFPGGRVLIPTGISVEIPKGYEMVVRPRSGLALKNGISIVNSPGTIDSDYRGEIGVVLINLSSEKFDIHQNDRIAQLALRPIMSIEWEEVEELSDTERGEKGYGSSGVSNNI